MKQWLQLTGWNFKLAQKPYLLVCALMAGGELALLLVAAGRKSNAALPFEVLFFISLAWLPLVLGYIAAMSVCLRPLLERQSQASYTVLTLPMKRSAILLAQIGSIAAALCGILALQLLLLVCFYPPVMALAQATTAEVLIGWPAPTGGTLALSFVRNEIVRILIPTSSSGIWTLLLLIGAPSILLPSAFFVKGRARAGAILRGVLGAGCCGVLVLVRMNSVFPMSMRASTVLLAVASAVLLCLMTASYLLALRSLKRAAYL